jgi:hypothetical protein
MKCSAIAWRASASAATKKARPLPRKSASRCCPSFLSVADDPTRTKFGDTWLSGSYDYDDEGQKAKRVDLIQDGVLKTFLMSRLPIASFANSNGHGRAQTGRVPNGPPGQPDCDLDQGVPETELRKMLIEEAKKQGKPYGLYFEDISSGFAVTTRNSPQAFQVIPLVVYRVYVDGRPDELVRGVSIVGTPLAAMKRILATGDKSEVFNGECGAESGSIPVSAVAPAMLLTEMETQRQPQGTERVPILPNPSATANETATAGLARTASRKGKLMSRPGELPCSLAVAASHALVRPQLRRPANARRRRKRSRPQGHAHRARPQSRSAAAARALRSPSSFNTALKISRITRPGPILAPALGSTDHRHQRVARVTVRVGDYKIDSSTSRGDGSVQLAALDDDPLALRAGLWQATDQAYKAALSAYAHKQAS